MGEHIHGLSCYADATADIESAAIWEAGLPPLTDDWADDLIRLARSQLGCGESERNYILADDGETKNGITRYGQWYGNPYGDWSGMFVLFCLDYAGIPQEAVPRSPGVYNMMRLAQDADIFRQPDGDLANSGSILFLDTDENGKADRLAVVAACENGRLTAIGGDWENRVAELQLSDGDDSILGYINIRKLQEDRNRPEETEPSVPTGPVAEITPEELPTQILFGTLPALMMIMATPFSETPKAKHRHSEQVSILIPAQNTQMQSTVRSATVISLTI
jgi:hypothetical protein